MYSENPGKRARKDTSKQTGLSTRLHWSFEDPAAVSGTEEEKRAKFREVRDQIEAKVKAWLAEQA